MKKRTIVLIVIIIAVLAVSGTVAITVINRSLQKLTETTVSEIDLNALPDGIYTGDYNSFPVGATVDVTVTNHRIVSIDLVRHQNGQGDAAEALPQHVVDAQSLDVDAISGATYSSKVILLAIENAFGNPPN